MVDVGAGFRGRSMEGVRSHLPTRSLEEVAGMAVNKKRNADKRPLQQVRC